MDIQLLTQNDFEAICTIYKEGIDTGIATFQTQVPTWQYWDNIHLLIGRIGAFQNGILVGWATLTPVSNRIVYSGVAEVSIYISKNYRYKGIGKILLQELIKISELNNMWTLQSSIFAENTPSIQLHLSCGFRIVGKKEKIGLHNNVWKDNVILERRSKVVGI